MNILTFIIKILHGGIFGGVLEGKNIYEGEEELMKEEELIKKLWEQDEQFRQIKEEHAWFHKKVEELDRKPFLTPAERLKREELKKRKLILKDRMEEMLAEFRRQTEREE